MRKGSQNEVDYMGDVYPLLPLWHPSSISYIPIIELFKLAESTNLKSFVSFDDICGIKDGVRAQHAMVPVDHAHCLNADLMLGHRLWRWPNIKPTWTECLVFSGSVATSHIGLSNTKLPTPGIWMLSAADLRRLLNVPLTPGDIGPASIQCILFSCEPSP